MRPSVGDQLKALQLEIQLTKVRKCRTELRDLFARAREIDGANQSVFDESARALGIELDRLEQDAKSKIEKTWLGVA